MAFVPVEQRNAHLASTVRLMSVQGRNGQPVSKATLTAISNTRKGSGDNRGEVVPTGSLAASTAALIGHFQASLRSAACP